MSRNRIPPINSSNLINDPANIAGFESASAGTAAGINPGVPWDIDENTDAFFNPQRLDGQRWDRFYPYRLLVIDIQSDNPTDIVSGGPSSNPISSRTSTAEAPEGGLQFTLTQEINNGTWEFNLPITPQMLKIQDNYAINTTATMRGIVEEHNGVRFKNISASGTTGIWTARPTRSGEPKANTSLNSIFGGTLTAFSDLRENISRVQGAFDGSHPATVRDAMRPGGDGEGDNTIFSTGYYQAQLLGQFLERYAQEKRKPNRRGWRLVFDIPKQNQSFIVTPVSFNLDQNHQNPMEYMFNFQLKAWKRINLESPTPAANVLPSPITANNFQRIVNTLRETRRTLGSAVNLIGAVRSDVQAPLDILRQTSLAVKDLAGVAFAAIDLPRQVINDFRSSISDSLNIIGNSFQRGPDGSSVGTLATGTTGSTASSLRASTQEARAGVAANVIQAQNRRNEGLSQSAVENGALGSGAIDSLATNEANNIFENPDTFFDFFDAVNVEDLSLSREQQERVDQEVDNVRLITVDDLRVFRSEIETLMFDISDSFGAGSAIVAETFGRQEPSSRNLDLTLEENEILCSLMESLQMFDLLTSTLQYDDLTNDNSLQFVGGLANEAGIDFNLTDSKLLVPVPFGLTIEEIAARYLGDPDQWVEIATLNSLSSPYIDEEGFFYDLLSNGDGRRINVNDSERRLYIGQTIILMADGVPQFSRKIISIDRVSDTNFLIAFDGDADLERLTTARNARIQGYLPGTINSQNQIFIPTDEAAQPDDRIVTPPRFDGDDLTRISKIDFLLDDQGDMAINQFGDFRLANGLTNLIQALRLKIRTERGTLLRHLEFGLGLQHGISVADINNGQIINSLNQMVQDDPRFSGINRINIVLTGSTLAVDMSVTIANGSGVVPITFNL